MASNKRHRVCFGCVIRVHGNTPMVELQRAAFVISQDRTSKEIRLGIQRNVIVAPLDLHHG